ncbi:Aste57867_22755 [Aphanomyces stellatus]|uniref:Aste57867_22755 protein n=1 Tax=Aphanomyces stellatus TaxID=120398 RepID=A0A485LKU4_9STRA|nr:hypothetical protein As57867_022685 [Aphanomyces stellatus]VFT99408.1 Aste57867_22755 [Aphanomyces stellatus]
MAKTQVFTKEEVACHNTETDCWFIIGRPGAKKVYNFTPFLNDHPGGPELVLTMAGEDVNDMFEDIGHTTDALKLMDQYCIGTLENDKVVDPLLAVPREVRVMKNAGSSAGDNIFLFVCLVVIALSAYYQMNLDTHALI